jgi:hypothetical protein
MVSSVYVVIILNWENSMKKEIQIFLKSLQVASALTRRMEKSLEFTRDISLAVLMNPRKSCRRSNSAGGVLCSCGYGTPFSPVQSMRPETY